MQGAPGRPSRRLRSGSALTGPRRRLRVEPRPRPTARRRRPPPGSGCMRRGAPVEAHQVAIERPALWTQMKRISGTVVASRAEPVTGMSACSGMRRGGWRAVELEEQLVGIAPPPVLAGLVRTDERVVGMPGPVGGCVPVRRVVAAADVAAGHAEAEVDPPATGAQAVLAPVARRGDLGRRAQMCTRLRHSLLPVVVSVPWSYNGTARSGIPPTHPAPASPTAMGFCAPPPGQLRVCGGLAAVRAAPSRPGWQHAWPAVATAGP